MRTTIASAHPELVEGAHVADRDQRPAEQDQGGERDRRRRRSRARRHPGHRVHAWRLSWFVRFIAPLRTRALDEDFDAAVLRARPSAVSFGAIGMSAPLPSTETRSGLVIWPLTSSATALRALDGQVVVRREADAADRRAVRVPDDLDRARLLFEGGGDLADQRLELVADGRARRREQGEVRHPDDEEVALLLDLERRAEGLRGRG